MGKKDKKESHSLISILPKLFKVLERILFEKMSSYFENILQDQQFGFQKRYSTQHFEFISKMGEENSVDKSKYFGALLTRFSKTFDHKLLCAKLTHIN